MRHTRRTARGLLFILLFAGSILGLTPTRAQRPPADDRPVLPLAGGSALLSDLGDPSPWVGLEVQGVQVVTSTLPWEGVAWYVVGTVRNPAAYPVGDFLLRVEIRDLAGHVLPGQVRRTWDATEGFVCRYYLAPGQVGMFRANLDSRPPTGLDLRAVSIVVYAAGCRTNRQPYDLPVRGLALVVPLTEDGRADCSSRTARRVLEGVVANPGPDAVAVIRLVLTWQDQDGALRGGREQHLQAPLESGQSTTFRFDLDPAWPADTRYTVSAEGWIGP